MYLFLRGRVTEHKWERVREGQGDTESKAGSRLGAGSTEPDAGLTREPRDPEQSRSGALNRLSHPGAPGSPLS